MRLCELTEADHELIRARPAALCVAAGCGGG